MVCSCAGLGSTRSIASTGVAVFSGFPLAPRLAAIVRGARATRTPLASWAARSRAAAPSPTPGTKTTAPPRRTEASCNMMRFRLRRDWQAVEPSATCDIMTGFAVRAYCGSEKIRLHCSRAYWFLVLNRIHGRGTDDLVPAGEASRRCCRPSHAGIGLIVIVLNVLIFVIWASTVRCRWVEKKPMMINALLGSIRAAAATGTLRVSAGVAQGHPSSSVFAVIGIAGAICCGDIVDEAPPPGGAGIDALDDDDDAPDAQSSTGAAIPRSRSCSRRSMRSTTPAWNSASGFVAGCSPAG